MLFVEFVARSEIFPFTTECDRASKLSCEIINVNLWTALIIATAKARGAASSIRTMCGLTFHNR